MKRKIFINKIMVCLFYKKNKEIFLLCCYVIDVVWENYDIINDYHATISISFSFLLLFQCRYYFFRFVTNTTNVMSCIHTFYKPGIVTECKIIKELTQPHESGASSEGNNYKISYIAVLWR